MGSSYEKAKSLDATYVMQTYGREPVEFVEGKGAKLWDDEGNEYLDFLAGIGVASVGHNNPKVVAAVQEQAGKLLHASNIFYTEHRGEVAERLSHMLAGDTNTVWRSFFANSGAEANECAIKTARRWGMVHHDGATGIITAKKSFHGRTLATLAATAQDRFQDPFAPLPTGFAHVPLNDIAALEQALDTEIDGTAPIAVMLECIQGESGVWPCTQEYLQAVRDMTKAHGMLLIIDEVQTGMGRCGKHFAFQTYGIEPDIVSIAKGVADGLPMGVCAARSEIAEVMKPGLHGSTFGGGPIVCAAADATTQIMCESGFLEHVEQVGSYLRAKLATLPFVTDVRGRGLMVGITLAEAVAPKVVLAGLAHGLVLNAPGPNLMRFLPPLVITDADVDMLIETLPDCYEEVTA